MVLMMGISETIKAYDTHAEQLVPKYESLPFEEVHAEYLDLMPSDGAAVLDVGAGSGRDAAWLAAKGCDVIAVEPAAGMLERAKTLHPEPRIRWLSDSLPSLERTYRLGLSFDLILLSAVWMHIPQSDRKRSFRKLITLLKPGGRLIVTLRSGPLSLGRDTYTVSVEEIEKLAREFGIAVTRSSAGKDLMEREEVTWQTLCLQFPDDGTEALPLLRHVILNDRKSATYKLALVRTLVRIADSAVGAARDIDEDTVAIPLGLVALYWLRLYKPLIQQGIAQSPSKLSFVKESFDTVLKLSPYELRIGARFTGDTSQQLQKAIIEARNTIHDMPAHHIKYPNTAEQIFKTSKGGKIPRHIGTLVIDEAFLWSLGEMRIPKHLWRALTRFASWIEPSLISEWIELMRTWNSSLDYGVVHQALTWHELEHDTTAARSIASKLLKTNSPIYCVWSGKRLQLDSIDIDHCFPFSAWPCADLWNLMPADRRINQEEKRHKLPTARTFEQSKERMLHWWQHAYFEFEDQIRERFISEVTMALPLRALAEEAIPDQVFEAMLFKRAALKQDLQLPDWHFSSH